MLTETQVRRAADPVLKKVLGPHGFDRAEIRFGDDFEGVPSIFIDIFFREGADAAPGDATLDALSGVADALERQGEARFPYIRPHYAGDEIGAE